MGLDGNVLSGEVVASDDDLVYIILGLGNGLGFEQRFEVACTSRSDGRIKERQSEKKDRERDCRLRDLSNFVQGLFPFRILLSG
eukprot:CAMPEP_0113479830 /NCGR_PEP_ID=MMETSP0014_2-20120614/21535_1 /TAXON_ID=2857 /ORGANISM="Nitzschia sp." /LENGTH=83 /DNA_ID=CAMNT_0000373187 /DNA_START=163 /DNA_END=414 /DNA_ORIENTATION=+ /assembly_acc=CAM_ASM_000159